MWSGHVVGLKEWRHWWQLVRSLQIRAALSAHQHSTRQHINHHIVAKASRLQRLDALRRTIAELSTNAPGVVPHRRQCL
jgi:hypothetical protein